MSVYALDVFPTAPRVRALVFPPEVKIRAKRADAQQVVEARVEDRRDAARARAVSLQRTTGCYLLQAGA